MLKIHSVNEAKAGILIRPDFDELPSSPAQRAMSATIFGEALSPDEAVRRILKSVRTGGDSALREWTEKLDGIKTPESGFRVSAEMVKNAYHQVPVSVVEAMKVSAERIIAFHKRQPIGSWFDSVGGGILGQKVCPIGRVGCYIPGGSAPLASTLLMTVLVAKAAGVPEIMVCTPPDRRTGIPAAVTLVAADIAGVEEIYALGGAQAIGAMAYGTQTIKRVDKICGPGNSFVVAAKRQVFGSVGIDALPGPTETAVVADETANPVWVAADMLAQSEHTGGSAILLTPSRTLIDAVGKELERQVEGLATKAAIRESFELRSGAVLTTDLAEAVALADEFAPEHLCLSVSDPWAWIGSINRAGGVFLGEHSYEVLGDYVAGPSHTMPTGGTARFTSPCNVLDFVRVMNLIALDEKTASKLAPAAVALAEAEGLAAHANAARIRLVK